MPCGQHMLVNREYDGNWIHDEVWGARSASDGGWIIVAGTGDEYAYSEYGPKVVPIDGIFIYQIQFTGTLQWEGLT